ncbi:MAG: hypothetical protein FD174_2393 [Geobacteraceae bacterium]|nr:MAG: hypothetical protein FD174_2393 [Geobacteraceae bacterium]
MGQRGFSLIEVLVVMGIIAILLAVATIQFNEWSRKAVMEGEIKRLYADLMRVRQEAVYSKRERTVVLAPSRYDIYSSNVTSVGALTQNTLTYPIVWNGAGNQITFNLRGTTDNQKSICIDPSDNPAAYDSIVVSRARVRLGKRDIGGNCATTPTNYIQLR